MNALYKILFENRPHTRLKFSLSEFPSFLTKALQGELRTKPRKTPHWWDNYPEVDSVKYENNTIQYQP